MSEGKPQGFQDLTVWTKGIVLVKRAYEVSLKFPDHEKFGLTSQIRRAAVSIPSNIAEGQARHTTREFIRGISNAEGSLAELETQLVISIELRYVDHEAVTDVFGLISEERKMLNALRRTLTRKLSTQS
jgi:carbamoyl-phosphate synthase large subunit